MPLVSLAQGIKPSAPGFAINTDSAHNQNQHWSLNLLNGKNNDDCIEVDSLNKLADYLDVSNKCIRVMPGTYRFDTSNVGKDKLFSDRYVLQFSGSNNAYIFNDVTFEFDSKIFRQFGNKSVNEFHVTGRNNVFLNLTMEDFGSTAPLESAHAVVMDGANNRIEGFNITTRGSYPYGYGDIFDNSTSGSFKHKKHSGILIRGDKNHLKGVNLIMRSYGDGIFVQGGHDVLIEDCYVEGELSTTDAVLAERSTRSHASKVNFKTAWGYDLDQVAGNYHFSLQGDGIRAYSTGTVFGTEESRNTGNITVKNSTVKFMRSGITLGLSKGIKHIENCTALGTETGFWVGSDSRVINSKGDASVGPLYSEDTVRSNSKIELTLLDDVVSKVGDTPTIYLAGDRHDIVLKNGTTFYNSKIELLIGGMRNGHRWLVGSDKEPLNRDADRISFDNQTPYPVILGSNSNRIKITSCGSVTDNGLNNSVKNSLYCN